MFLFPSNNPKTVHHALRPRKIPPEQRIRKPDFRSEPNPLRRLVWRLRCDSQFLRSFIQLVFALLCVWIGIEFYLFMKWGQGSGPFYERPPGVEGFLPISALMSLRHWVLSGTVNSVHPAALFIFLAIAGVSIIVKKSFCSWLCPIGSLSESLWMLGQKVFGRSLTIPRWLDLPLRSIKYLLLYFFIASIWSMDLEALERFIDSPYNKVADIKMYLFFADLSMFAFWTILILIVFSLVIKNAWCRFLCPYGALLGIAGMVSPLKIKRNAETCVDCELCTKACPSGIAVHKTRTVWSDECTSCMLCVAACPVKNTLSHTSPIKAKSIPGWLPGTLVIGGFVLITGLAMLTGLWQNSISREEYQRRFGELHRPIYQHFRGEVPEYGPED